MGASSLLHSQTSDCNWAWHLHSPLDLNVGSFSALHAVSRHEFTLTDKVHMQKHTSRWHSIEIGKSDLEHAAALRSSLRCQCSRRQSPGAVGLF